MEDNNKNLRFDSFILFDLPEKIFLVSCTSKNNKNTYPVFCFHRPKRVTTYSFANSVDIQTSPVPSTELIINVLKTFSMTIPAVQSGDAWVGKNIGIAIRAVGLPGGYWDLDNVHLVEFQTIPDFTDDSFVNLQDFAVMASEWLSCTEAAADLTGDGCVDTEDLLILAEYWLSYV